MKKNYSGDNVEVILKANMNLFAEYIFMLIK